MTQWISVKERLPDEGNLVLTLEYIGHTVEYKLDYRILLQQEWIWANRRDEAMYRVTHWMPLPEPPKEEA